jgi:vacuolar-type H+-ATPase subunit H
MPRHRSETQSDPVVSAIERVLEAERIGETQVEHCRQQAQAMVAAARETAAAIARRTNARTAKLHGSYLQKIARDIARLGHPAESESEIAENPSDIAAWSEAAERLAAKLTDGEDETPR